jgi:hypothetical protein
MDVKFDEFKTKTQSDIVKFAQKMKTNKKFQEEKLNKKYCNTNQK